MSIMLSVEDNDIHLKNFRVGLVHLRVLPGHVQKISKAAAKLLRKNSLVFSRK